MTELSIDIPIENIAKLINAMNKQELETLYLHFNGRRFRAFEKKRRPYAQESKISG